MKRIPNLAPTIDKIARAAIGKDWALYGALLQHWPEIVGESYAKNTTPVKVIFPQGKKNDEQWASNRKGGTLTIRAPKGLSMELTFAFETIRARINGFFGYAAIDRITLEPVFETPPPPAPPKRELSRQEIGELAAATIQVENEELREALANLGASILREN